MQMLRNICIIFLLPLPFFRESCESRISCSSKPPAKEVIFPALLTCFHAHCGDYQSNATQSLHLIHSGFLLKSLMSKIYSKIVPLFPKKSIPLHQNYRAPSSNGIISLFDIWRLHSWQSVLYCRRLDIACSHCKDTYCTHTAISITA